MIGTGEQLRWDCEVVADKHCVGGLPGNRTTPIIVAIVAAAGLTIPKTSSRAITSPAGTADTMETLTRVTLDVHELRRVVERTGAALAWGGALNLSPSDDVMIRVERALDIDSDAQLIASILSKKVAAGATHVLIDVPVGRTAKVRSEADLLRLESFMQRVAAAFGLQVMMVHTDGSQPDGRGIGPALEAHDVLAVLRRDTHAPADLRRRALLISGLLLEFCGAGQARRWPGQSRADPELRRRLGQVPVRLRGAGWADGAGRGAVPARRAGANWWHSRHHRQPSPGAHRQAGGSAAPPSSRHRGARSAGRHRVGGRSPFHHPCAGVRRTRLRLRLCTHQSCLRRESGLTMRYEKGRTVPEPA